MFLFIVQIIGLIIMTLAGVGFIGQAAVKQSNKNNKTTD